MKVAPKTAFSEVVGWGARRTLPKPLRSPVYGIFARAVGAKLHEVEHSLDSYPSFGKFFSRGLKPGARPIDAEPDQWVSPCDCQLAEFGSLGERVIEVKGQSFSLPRLLRSERLAQRFLNGQFATLYLSPKDYHRVHVPIDCQLLGYRYVPGRLFPVKPLFLREIDALFSVNERIVLSFDSEQGRFALVMVAATGVGNMRLLDPSLESRFLRKSRTPQEVNLETPLAMQRGQELGAFELGSTVVLCTEKPMFDLSNRLGTNLRFGEALPRAAGRENR